MQWIYIIGRESQDMVHSSRVANLQQVSRELDTRYLGFAHREQVLTENLKELHALHLAAKSLRSELAKQQIMLNRLTQRLPVLARKEAIDRITQRLDATPFEEFAQSPTRVRSDLP